MNAKQDLPQGQSTQSILSVAQAFVPLCALKANHLEYLLEQASLEYVCAGDPIFARGICDLRHIYLLSGRVRLKFASGYQEVVNARDTLDALAAEMPRPCEAVADTDCTLLIIDSDRLDRILSWSQIAQYLLADLCAKRDLDEDMDWIKTVLNSNLFFKVPPVNAERILDRMRPEVVMAGEVIVREGEIGNCCYFIKEGAARVTAHENGAGVARHLADITVGRCFGEDALVYETVRNASVTMTSDGVLMRLDKDAFKLLLTEPHIEEISATGGDNRVEDPVFIDVRTQQEYEQGHLALAANFPLSILALKRRLLRQGTTYIFYCDTGRRSRAAAYLLAEQGYSAVALRGGLVGAGMQYQLITDISYILKDGRTERC